MKKIKLSPITAAGTALLIVMAGFPGCAWLEAPTETASATPRKSSRNLLYQQSVEQGKSGETANETFLGDASDPNWGPLPLNIRW